MFDCLGWIRSRRDTQLTLDATNKLAPKSWKEWLKKGANFLNRARRRVSKLNVKKTADQKPVPGSEEDVVLNEIYDYYADKKHQFEALAEVIAERVIGSDKAGYEKGWITAAGGDGGADFVASVRLGTDFSSARIIVLGQAKCVALSNPTHGNHIARTVARLKRGWIGAFVTTSYFSESVQQEVIEDSYPIVLIHGRRIAEEVIKIVHEDDRFPNVVTLLDELTAAYPDRIHQGQPEELLRVR